MTGWGEVDEQRRTGGGGAQRTRRYISRNILANRFDPISAEASGFLSGQTDNETLVRAQKFLNGYFKSIMDANPTRWQNGRTAFICVNPGIRAHFQLITF
jgi:hypothetical protein